MNFFMFVSCSEPFVITKELTNIIVAALEEDDYVHVFTPDASTITYTPSSVYCRSLISGSGINIICSFPREGFPPGEYLLELEGVCVVNDKAYRTKNVSITPGQKIYIRFEDATEIEDEEALRYREIINTLF